jgi:TonB family protein
LRPPAGGDKLRPCDRFRYRYVTGLAGRLREERSSLLRRIRRGKCLRLRRVKRYRAGILLFNVVCAAGIASPAAAQDFSEIRLRQGRDAYRSHRPIEAIDPLRVAAFGLLDRPVQLCEALVYLALAQEAAGRHADAQTAVERLADIARRFPTCAAADVDRTARSEFETRFRRRLFGAVGVATSPTAAAARLVPSRSDASEPTVPLATTVSARLPNPEVPEPPPQADPRNAEVGGQDGGTPARIKRSVLPVYPRGAREARAGGTVVLRILVSETGRPLLVQVVRGVRPDLADAAVASVQKWTFEPARQDGREIQSWMMVEIPFRP